jgi:hypothetical protein
MSALLTVRLAYSIPEAPLEARVVGDDADITRLQVLQKEILGDTAPPRIAHCAVGRILGPDTGGKRVR